MVLSPKDKSKCLTLLSVSESVPNYIEQKAADLRILLRNLIIVVPYDEYEMPNDLTSVYLFMVSRVDKS